jgi:hypothetical protein
MSCEVIINVDDVPKIIVPMCIYICVCVCV